MYESAVGADLSALPPSLSARTPPTLSTPLTAGPVALFILVSFYSQLNQPVQQMRIREAARLPKLGIHTDLGKPWQRINLVDIDEPGLFLQKEIYASQT